MQKHILFFGSVVGMLLIIGGMVWYANSTLGSNGGVISLGSGVYIRGLSTPSDNTDAASKSYVDAAGKSPKAQVFTADGTWTRPSGVTVVFVSLIGGGGGGGGGCTGVNCNSSGGGSGYFALDFPVDVSTSSTVPVTVGGGGGGGSYCSSCGPGQPGTSGSASYFGSLAVAGGVGGRSILQSTGFAAAGGAGGQNSVEYTSQGGPGAKGPLGGYGSGGNGGNYISTAGSAGVVVIKWWE
ncbi:MAG: hypothetical protein NUV53_01625 [Patescibacteria group bacterium]|nr:hypothetical protein [Patescibacteria group bacterium]